MYSPQENKEKIVACLEELEEGISFEATEWSEEVIENLVDMASRGKMIRGSLLIDAYDAMGGKEEVVEYAAAIELVHTGLLIHDDIIDRDEVRRGQKALHVQYRSEEISDREAKNLAMCAGDVAYFLAFKLISDSDIQSTEALSIFSSTFARVGLGEMTDVELSVKEGEIRDIIQMYRDKTASYTFAMPLRLAAVLAGRDDRRDLKNLGLKLGVLYQIKDDHLDLFSEKGDTGKPDASDIVEGKTTLHTEMLKQRTGTEINGDSEVEAQRLISEMEENAIDRTVEKEMMDRKEGIEERIQTLNPELRKLLKQVVELIIERNR